MKKRNFAALIAAALLCCYSPAGRAEANPQEQGATDIFPSAREFYYPLKADPMELESSGRYLWQQGGGRYAEVNIGDYLGLLRWSASPGWDIQLNIGGGVLARFDMNSVGKALQVADYTACAPLDFHHGAHTLRTGYWHTSSHLGDDLIASSKIPIEKRSQDLFRAIYSWTPADWIRAYGGGAYAVNVVNVDGRRSVQGGLEWTVPLGSSRQQVFLAQDLQSLERVKWNPAYTLRAGLRAASGQHVAAAKLFVEYFTGHYNFIQLYERKETRWGMGVSFEIGNPTK